MNKPKLLDQIRDLMKLRNYTPRTVLGDPKADPPVPPVIPVSKSTWWQGVKGGRFPKPIKLGSRTTVWRAEGIRALVGNAG